MSGSLHRTEGDINISDLRNEFTAEHLNDETRAVLAEDALYFLHQSLSTPCLNVLQHVEGSSLVDAAGRRILDFHGNSVHQVGYAHPRVVAAVKQQLDELSFCPRRYTNSRVIELARRLSELAPVRPADAPAKILLAPGGALAIGMALKLARYATGRYKTISMWDAFHGASLDAISVGGEALFREGLGPLLPGCLHVPPYADEGVGRHSSQLIEDLLAREGDIAAVLAEPMRWTTVVPPPAEYWQQIRASCDAHGALLIFDEIPACLGRTGRWFCTEHFGVEPDLLVIGKGLGGGVFPLAALIARGDLNVAAERALGHYTHEKTPVGAAAALATLDTIEEENLLEKTRELGKSTLEQLEALQSELGIVHAVRGLGLQLAVELQQHGQPAAEAAEQIFYSCLRRGLSFKISDGNVLTLSPPLTISAEELEQALEILTRAIREVA